MVGRGLTLDSSAEAEPRFEVTGEPLGSRSFAQGVAVTASPHLKK
ncbi:MAG: hypothetical protein AVDCRST_MAG86-3707 [uncultured Truepera sp.]|uniref:Uncharacterized protein n=1 Tax=uncultured Truepera sp. TaxID=543023 RepID=A0A6J4VWE8_9DEIN|nr:MAG: hypothetical protein AVDCRST_MAG86-3707 [uncultured Truepera sp.]